MTRFFPYSLLSVAIAAHAQTSKPVGSIFDPRATPAESVFHLSQLVLAVCLAIFLIVAGLLTYTIVRFRRKEEDFREPAQVYGSNQLEIAWTIIPIVIVFVLVMATARVVNGTQNHQISADALHATVVGHQFWWEIRYPELGVVTANELHVPVKRETVLSLESADVAHSFWIPQLAGKTDMFPGRTNTMWIDPRETGTFLGNCAEYCGTQHANMLIRVIVQSSEEFDSWIAAQKDRALESAYQKDGQRLFLSMSCVNCHTVSGTSAAGTFGPDLSHLGSRETLAAGAISNSKDKLRAFLEDPQRVKPGCLMPNMQLSQKELEQLAGYLSSLK